MGSCAIIIGINTYCGNLRPLSYAKQDAERVRAFITDQSRFDPQQIYFFAEESPPIRTAKGFELSSDPTYGNLYGFLHELFEQPFLDSSEDIWFFFAGHGYHSGQDYLMPRDGSSRTLGTALSIRWIVERLKRSGAGNVILLLDACRDQFEQTRGGQGIGMEEHQGVVEFYSCQPRQSAFELDRLQGGAFTHTLLEGLRTRGPGGCATVERLDQYLNRRVPEVLREYSTSDNNQNPRTSVNPLTRKSYILLPELAQPEDTVYLKVEALIAELQEDYDLARQLWRRVLAVWADPDALSGLERIAERRYRQKERLRELHQQISDLQAQQTQQEQKYQAEIEQQRSIIHTQVEQIQSLQSQLEIREQELLQTQKQLQHLEAERDQLQAQLQRTQAQAQDQLQQARDREQHLQAQIQQLTTKRDQAQAQAQAPQKDDLSSEKGIDYTPLRDLL